MPITKRLASELTVDADSDDASVRSQLDLPYMTALVDRLAALEKRVAELERVSK